MDNEQLETTTRRPLTHEELRLLADMLIVEFPELRRRGHGDVLDGWRRLAEKHSLVVEHRKPSKRPAPGVVER